MLVPILLLIKQTNKQKKKQKCEESEAHLMNFFLVFIDELEKQLFI